MKKWLFTGLAILALFLLAGCDENATITITGMESLSLDSGPDYRVLPVCPDASSPYVSLPPAEVPYKLRQANYGPSCNHASFISVLRYFGRDEIADRWRREHYGSAGVQDLARIADSYHLDYAMTAGKQNVEFLEWCSRTRRPAAIHYYPVHAVTFVGFSEDGDALLIDNRWSDFYVREPKATFIRNWIAYGSCAITLTDSAPPARPWVCNTHKPSSLL